MRTVAVHMMKEQNVRLNPWRLTIKHNFHVARGNETSFSFHVRAAKLWTVTMNIIYPRREELNGRSTSWHIDATLPSLSAVWDGVCGMVCVCACVWSPLDDLPAEV